MAAWQCRYIIRLFIACQANWTLFSHELTTRDRMKGFTGLFLCGLSLLRNRFIKSQQHLVVLWSDFTGEQAVDFAMSEATR